MAYFEVGSMQGVFEMDEIHFKAAHDICRQLGTSSRPYSLGIFWDEKMQMPHIFAYSLF